MSRKGLNPIKPAGQGRGLDYILNEEGRHKRVLDRGRHNLIPFVKISLLMVHPFLDVLEEVRLFNLS